MHQDQATEFRTAAKTVATEIDSEKKPASAPIELSLEMLREISGGVTTTADSLPNGGW